MSMRSPGSPPGSTNRSATRWSTQAESLVAVAATSTVDAFERHVADLAAASRVTGSPPERLRAQRSLRRWTDRETGMCHTHLTLDPEADAMVSAALDAAIAAERAKPDSGRSFDQLRADAFVTLVTSRAGAGRRPAQSASSSTTPPSSTACTNARCARPATGSRVTPTRCAAWRATPS